MPEQGAMPAEVTCVTCRANKNMSKISYRATTRGLRQFLARRVFLACRGNFVE